MSTTIDERVVEMRFDNRNFEQNVAQSMSTLDKLKAKLNIGNSAKSLDTLGSAAKKVDLGCIGKSIDTVHAKFSALEVIGVTALANITNSAVNMSKRLVKAVTIDPVSTGFSEYETKINAIQTIMSNTASKGTTMEDVTRVIDELNTYADKTIYNFAEMTRNIGTFTAAGVGLEESASAIQGIANLAAASGSTSQQASTAMYQLSQALAAGTVKLMDWNSVVNAGMGGEKFQEALKATAREHGIAVDEIIKKNGSFRESLQEGWISADILNETLNKFTVEGATAYANSMMESGKWTREQADALIKEAENMEAAATKVKTFTQLIDTLKESLQSGWGKTWELIFGDFLEARDFFSELSERLGGIVDKLSDWRNDILQGALDSKWSVFESRLEKAGISVDTFTNRLKEIAKSKGIDIDKILDKFGTIGNAFAKGALGKGLILDTFKSLIGAEGELADATGLTTDKLDYFQKMVTEVVRGDWGNGIDRFNALSEAGHDYAAIQEQVNNCWDGATLDLTKMTVAQIESLGYTEEQAKALKELAEEAEKTGTPLNELIESLEKPSGRELFIDSIRNTLDSIGLAFKTIKTAWNDIFPPKSIEERSAALYKVIEAIHGITVKVEEFLGNEDNVNKLVRSFKGLFAVIDIIMTLAGGGLRLVLTIVSEVLGLFGYNVLDVTANIGDMIVALRDWIDAHNPLTKAITFIGPHLKVVIEAIKEWIEGAKQAENVPKYIAQGIIKGIKGAVTAIVNLAKALMEKTCELLGIHSPSTWFFEIGKFIVLGLINGIKYFADKVVEVVTTLFGKVKEVASKFDIGAILSFGLGTGLLVVISKIASILDMLADPFEGLQDIFEQVAGAVKRLGSFFKASAFEKRCRGILELAIALGVLAASLSILSKIDPDRLWSCVGAIAAMAAVMAALAFVANTMKSVATSSFNALIIIGIAVSLLIMAKALNEIANIKIEDVPRVVLLLGLAVVSLLILGYALEDLTSGSRFNNMNKAGTLMIKMGFALLLMVGVYKLAGMLDLGEIKRGSLVIFLSTIFFGLIIDLFKGMKSDAGQYADKAGKMILKISIAMVFMVLVMKLAGQLDKGEIKRGAMAITAIGLIFAALIVVSKFAGEHAHKAGLMIMLMASSFVLLGIAMHIVAKLDDKGLERGIKAIITMGIVFTLLITISSLAGKNAAKAGVMLVLMSTALIVVSVLIYIVGNMDTSVVFKGIAALSALMIMFGVLIAASHLAGEAKGTIIALTFAIAVLTIALIALSFIKPDKLITATISLGLIIGIFAALMYVMQYTRRIRAKTVVPILITLTLMIAVMAIVLARLSKLDPKKSLGAAASLSLMMVALAAVLYTISKIKIGKDIFATLGVLLLLSTVFVALAGIMKLIDLINPKTSIETIGSLSLMLSVLTGVLFVISKMPKFDKHGFAAIGGLALLIPILGILALVMTGIRLLEPMPSIETVAKLSLMMVVLTGVLFVISKMKNFGLSGYAAVGALALLVLVLGELALVMTGIRLLEPMPSIETIGKLSLMLTVLTGVLFVISLMKNFGTSGYAAVGVLAILVLVLGELALVMAGIRLLEPMPSLETILKLSLMLIALTGVLLVISLMKGFGLSGYAAVGALALLVLVLGELALVMTGIRLLEPMPSIETILKLTLILYALSGALAILGVVGKLCGGNALLVGVLALAGIAAVIGAAIWAFAEFVSPSLPKLGENLSEFAMTLLPFIATMSLVKESCTTGATNLAKCITALAGANIIASISKLFGGGSFEAAGELLLSFGDYMAKFNDKIKHVDAEAVNASANAADMLVKLVDIVPRTGGKLNQIFESIFGTKDLTGFGEMLVSFGKSIVEFSKTVAGNVDAEAVEAAAKAAEMMTTLADKIPNSGGLLGDFFGNNDIDTFGKMLVSFGKSIVEFSDILTNGNVNAEVIESVSKIGTMLTDMADTVPNSGGILGEWLGNNDIDKFGEMLVSFGKSIVEFSDTLIEGGLDKEGATDAMEAAAAAGTMLANMADAIPNSDGFFENIFGNNDMDKFGKKLVPFGEALVEFSNTLNKGKFDSAATKGAAEAADTLAVMAQKIPSDCDWADKLFGNNDIDTFGTKLGAFGTGIKAFADATKGMDVSGINNANTALGPILRLVENVDSGAIDAFNNCNVVDFAVILAGFGIAIKRYSDSMVGVDTEQIVTCTNTLVKIVNTIKSMKVDDIDNLKLLGGAMDEILSGFGEGMKAYSEAVVDLDTTSISNAESSVDSLINLIKSVDPDDISTFVGISFSSFAVKLGQFASVIVQFSDIMSTVDTDKVITAADQFTKIVDAITGIKPGDVTNLGNFNDALGKVSVEAVENFVTAFEDGGDRVVTSIVKMTEESVGKIRSKKQTFKTEGTALISYIGTGFKDGEPTVTSAAKDVTNASITAVRNRRPGFEGAGKYLVEGLAKGMEDNSYLATQKAKAVAEATMRAIEDAFVIKSPSKVAYKDGEYVVIGIAKGLIENAKRAYDAGKTVAEAAKTGLSNAISRISRMVDSEMDTQPTIRPVLDLSNVQSGVSAIGRMFNYSPAVDLMSNVSAIDTMMNMRSQNGINSDVVSAIDKLRGELGGVGGTTNIIEGITYDDGSAVQQAVQTLVRAARIERRS